MKKCIFFWKLISWNYYFLSSVILVLWPFFWLHHHWCLSLCLRDMTEWLMMRFGTTSPKCSATMKVVKRCFWVIRNLLIWWTHTQKCIITSHIIITITCMITIWTIMTTMMTTIISISIWVLTHITTTMLLLMFIMLQQFLGFQHPYFQPSDMDHLHHPRIIITTSGNERKFYSIELRACVQAYLWNFVKTCVHVVWRVSLSGVNVVRIHFPLGFHTTSILLACFVLIYIIVPCHDFFLKYLNKILKSTTSYVFSLSMNCHSFRRISNAKVHVVMSSSLSLRANICKLYFKMNPKIFLLAFGKYSPDSKKS